MSKIQYKPKKIALLTDSCADLSIKTASENNIYIVPLRIMCSDGEYLDGVDIANSDIYKYHENGEIPKTSLPSGSDIVAAFDKIVADGYDGVIAVMFSGGLSGTYNFVKMLSEERNDMIIEVFDSGNASLGLSMILLQLAEDIQNNMSWTELIEYRIPFLIKNTFAFFSVDTLEYLHKGGRIGHITAIAGTLLQIKPIITFSDDGKLKTAAKVCGNRQLIDKLAELTYNAGGSYKKYNLAVANGGMQHEMNMLHSKLMLQLPDYKNIWSGEIGATLSVHIGKGILGTAIQILE